MPDIGGITDLAHLAIADHVDADLGLTMHHIHDAAAYHVMEVFRIEGFAAILRKQQVDYILGPWKAAYVSGKKPVCA